MTSADWRGIQGFIPDKDPPLGKRLFPIASTRKLEPASDRCTISVVITSFAVGPTRVMHPSELHSVCHAEIYSTPAALLKASICSSRCGPDTPSPILSAML